MSRRHVISLEDMETNEGRMHDLSVKMLKAAREVELSPDQLLNILGSGDETFRLMLLIGHFATVFTHGRVQSRHFSSRRTNVYFVTIAAKDPDSRIIDLLYFLRCSPLNLRLPIMEESWLIQREQDSIQSLVLSQEEGDFLSCSKIHTSARRFDRQATLRDVGTDLPFLALLDRAPLWNEGI